MNREERRERKRDLFRLESASRLFFLVLVLLVFVLGKCNKQE